MTPEGPLVAADGFVAGYRPSPGTYDELADDNGRVRPHWAPLVALLDGLGASEMKRRWAQAQELIHENGVSYNIYGDAQGMERPWPLSPVPALLSGASWSTLVTALTQRARLFESLLADIYGPQACLKDGSLPPELVFGHPGFLRACQGLPAPNGRWLPLYAADLVRGPDGRFRVLSDRTQVPTGMGYALENRIIVSRTLPDVFRDFNVERLARFFRTVRDTLASLAPRNRDNPRVVMLTSGPADPTYFEQAYLAQYLGYPLVHGGDLTVREGRVFLKTLGGLHAVDVILRRVHDELCDPLELRPDSLLGIPGLVQAVRERSVAIANPLGTGLVATPALLPFLPGLCRSLLGEDLQMPSVTTWWCGDPEARAQVLDRLHELVIKPAFTVSHTEPVFGGGLDRAGLDALRARIVADPRAVVAQEQVPLATTPTLNGDRLEPRHWVLRTFLVATGAGHTVMPGGLARFAPSPEALEVSIARGGGSQDTWIASTSPVNTFSLLPPTDAPIALSRGGGDLPSRVADNLFWLGRYTERAEGLARLGRVIAVRLGDQDPLVAAGAEVGPLLRALVALTHQPVSDQPGSVASTLASGEAVFLKALSVGKEPGSLPAVVRDIHRVGRECRDRISVDTWRILTSLEQDLAPSPDGGDRIANVLRGLNQTIVTLAAFSGLAMDSMTHGQAWRFLDLGRRLERAFGVAALVFWTLGGVCEREGPLLEAVLEAADSGMTYRRRYLNHLQVAPAVDLLLTDESNPRSVVFQLTTIAEHIAQLPRDASVAMRTTQERLVLQALSDLRLADVDATCATDLTGGRTALGALLRRLLEVLPRLSDSLGASYLNHAAVSRQLSGGPGEMAP